ncbi:MAG: serine/threonine-protein phosphatase [Methylobacter sp.]|nr:serine/threonine-protein phosphatase [Methylobacter sp.]
MSFLSQKIAATTPTDDSVITPVALPKKRLSFKLSLSDLQAAFFSATGLTHQTNEDCCIHSPDPEAPVFCAVADGVGGGAYGEVASRALIEHCALAPRSVYRSPKKIVAWLHQADTVVGQAVARYSDRPGASTLVAAWFMGLRRVHVVNIGDCRAYRLTPRFWRGYRIKQITVDQTYANLGRQTPAKGKPDDPCCMAGVGVVGTPKVVTLRLLEGELLLLCSDGLHKFLSDQAMLQLYVDQLRQNASLGAICHALVSAAKANGSYDDISVLLVKRRRCCGAALHYWLGLLAALALCI